jgi:hypothetical protein
LAYPLENDTPNSLGIGFGITTPTLFVGAPNQRVGIGNVSPETSLHVEGTITVDQKIQADDSGGLEIATDEGTTRLKINDNGYVGIGTTSPNDKLDVNGFLRVGNSAGGSSAIRFTDVGALKWALLYRPWVDSSLTVMDNMTAGRNVMTFQRGTGRVGIGTTSPAAPLEVLGAEDTDVLLFDVNGDRFSFVVHTYGPDYMTIRTKAENPNTDIISFLGSGYVGIGTAAPSYKLDVEGDIQCTTLYQTSDDHLKTNVSQLCNALNNITKVHGVSFEWNQEAESVGASAGDKQIGVLASEVEAVYPELVSTSGNGYKSVDYTKLTAVLIEAVKELKNENEILKEEIESIRSLMK